MRKMKSERAAAAGVPAEAVGAHARAWHDDDRGRGNHDRTRADNDSTAHRAPATIGAAVPAGAATAGGAGRLAETNNGAGEHHGGKQIFHLIFLLVLGGRCWGQALRARIGASSTRACCFRRTMNQKTRFDTLKFATCR